VAGRQHLKSGAPQSKNRSGLIEEEIKSKSKYSLIFYEK
jgi:hypothetical protein